jgi:hypothetical protein
MGLAVTGFAAMSVLSAIMPAHADERRRAVAPPPPPRTDRDCTPINGRSGYYGNPWCDTGSYRLEDIWFRERQAAIRRFATEKAR